MNDVNIPSGIGVIADISRRLHDNRRRLRSLLSPEEYERVAPLIEQCEPFSLRAELYRSAGDACLAGGSFGCAGTPEEVARVCGLCRVRRR